MATSTGLKIAIKLTGVNFETGIEKTFHFSNAGFVANIDGDNEQIYYEPLLKDSILSNIQSDSTDDSVSIRLINNGLNELSDYLFNGYPLEVYVSSNYAPSSTNWYPMYKGACKTLIVKRLLVDIKAVSNFDIFNKSMNPETFRGVRGEYEGDEDLKGKTKPRLFGKVFNITPVLLRSDNLVFGCNWKFNGLRESVVVFESIRDGGAELILDITDSAGGDYESTASMDAYQPSTGEYVTCTAEGTFKLGSSPVYGVTCDVTQQTQTYTDIVQMYSIELNFEGYIIHYAPSYILGFYLDTNVEYVNFNNQIIDNLDLTNWFDGSKKFNVTSLRNLDSKISVARFIDAGQSFKDDQDIVVFSIDRVGYELPPKQIQVGYKKNYTVQNQDQLAGVTTQEEKEIYKRDFDFSTRYLTCNSDIYINQESKEYLTSIQYKTDADTESYQWLNQRRSIVDRIQVTCPILSANSLVILGVIVDQIGAYVNIASTNVLISNDTILINNNNTNYSGQRTLQMGDPVLLDSLYFDYADSIFIVYGIAVNTKTMQVTYDLVGHREISKCNLNVVDTIDDITDNIVDGVDNIVDNL